METNESPPLAHMMYKINLKGIIDLVIKAKIIKRVKENTGVNLSDLEFDKNFYIGHKKHELLNKNKPL